MEPEAVLNLFDSTWFYLKLFEKTQPKTSIPPNPQTHEKKPSKLNVPRQLTIHTRSKSDQLLIATETQSPEPQKPQLQTILSEREINLMEIQNVPIFKRPGKGVDRRRKKKGFSKSLSELEFEEMKGFMDLGFVFSEEDKEDSGLVGIVPGLHKLGLSEEGFSGRRARPYLSEAWEVESPLMKWRLPAVSNEIDMKDSLKWWAHSVASAVR